MVPNTFKCISCIKQRSLTYGVFWFRLAVTGPGRRGVAHVRKPRLESLILLGFQRSIQGRKNVVVQGGDLEFPDPIGAVIIVFRRVQSSLWCQLGPTSEWKVGPIGILVEIVQAGAATILYIQARITGH